MPPTAASSRGVQATHETVEPSRAAGRALDVNALYEEHAPRLLSWLSGRVPRSRAEDLHQEVWLRVVRAYQTQFDGENFRAWLFTIARNLIYDGAGNAAWRNTCPLEDMPTLPHDPNAPQPPDIVADMEERRLLADCISQLGEPQRSIVALRMAGEDYRTIESTIRVTAARATAHFHAAKKLLKTCVQTKKGAQK
jgi:RNA polymerase sigma-70 factor (ECF subfamily)